MITKVTSAVLDDNIEVKTLNGCEISIFAKPNAIPKANASGILDASWGSSGSGSGGTSDMTQSTYDTNADGIVNAADVASKLSGTPGINYIWGSLNGTIQKWIKISDLALNLDYDTNADGIVNAADVASKLSGTPGANKLWGTDATGTQTWISTTNGDMSRSIYDTNADGIVNASDISSKLAGTPVANQIWGTDSTGTQTWIDLNLSKIMMKSNYDPDGNGNKVSKASFADKLASESSAAVGTIYFKNYDGTVAWEKTENILSTSMNKLTYDPDGDGKVNAADVADSLSSEASALYPTVYCKIDSGKAKFIPLSTLNSSIMYKTSYDIDNDGVIDNAKNADKISGIDSIDIAAKNIPAVAYGKYIENGLVTTGFTLPTAMDPNILFAGRWSSIYYNRNSLGTNINTYEAQNLPFIQSLVNNSKLFVDNSIFSSYIRTDIAGNTPKKGYSYVLTGEKVSFKSNYINELYETETEPKSFDVNKYVWSGWNGLHGAKIRLAGNIAVSQSTETTITWAKEDYDSENLWEIADPTKIKIPSTPNAPMNWCRLSFNVKFLESSSTSGIRRITIYKNGVILPDFAMVELNKTNTIMTNCMGCSGPLSILPSDYFTISIYHENSGTLTIDSTATYFALELI